MATYKAPKKNLPTSLSRVSSSLAGTPRSGNGLASVGAGTTRATPSDSGSYFQNNATGNIVTAGRGTPVASNQNYTHLGQIGATGLKSGAAPAMSFDANGMPILDAGFTRTLGATQGSPTNLRGGVANTAAATPGSTVTTGALGAASGEGGITASNTGLFSNISTGTNQSLGGVSQRQTAPSLIQNASAITPEGLAGRQLTNDTNYAAQGLQDATANYQSTTGLLGSQYGQNSNYVSQQQQVALNQAQRNLADAKDEQSISKAKADMEYEQSVAQIQSQRADENSYLKQKLASSGATNSSAGVEILSKSAEKYDSIFGQLAGQRQIGLAEFALSDSKIRNQYATTVENVVMQTTQMQQQLAQEFQTEMLAAQQGLQGSKTDASKAQSDAYTNYLNTLYGIQEARSQAETAAQAAAAAAQQQAFDNAISKAGLTGTFIDPTTGEQVRTLNGMKFDQSTVGGSGGGSGSYSGADLSTLIQQGIQTGLITNDQVEAIVKDPLYAQALASQLAQVTQTVSDTMHAPDGTPFGNYSKQGINSLGWIPSSGSTSTTTYNYDPVTGVKTGETTNKGSNPSSTPNTSAPASSGGFLSNFWKGLTS